MTDSRRFGLSACSLRLLAMGLMLLDHLWVTGILASPWATCLGRLAFPVFAFQVSEGSVHTHDVRRYCGRLALFALISELPFDLMTAGRIFAPEHQNVMFTLLLGLLAIRFTDRCLQDIRPAERLGWLCGVAACLLCAQAASTDYGMLGVLTVLSFRLARELPHTGLWQLVFLTLLHGFAGGPAMTVGLGTLQLEVPVQAFAVLALIPIRLYSGRKGCSSPLLQWAAYWFYPVHLLILALI